MTGETTIVDVVMTEATKVEIGRVVDLREMTVGVGMTEAVAIGIAPNVTTQTLHLEQNVIAVESLVALVVETTVATETTEEEATEAIKTETDKVDGSIGMTVDVEMTEAVAIGNAQNVETQTLHLEQNVIAVESLVALVADVVPAEATIEASKIVTVKVGVSKEMTVGGITEEVAIGIVLNVETQTLPSEPNAINVDYREVVEATVDGAEITGDVVEKHTTTMIGNVRSVKTQTSPSEPSVTAVERLALVVEGVDLTMMTVEDRRVEMNVRGHHAEIAETGHLAVKMEEDLLVVMVETEETREVMETEVHTTKTEHLNANQENLVPLENHEEMAQVMHTTNLQNQSADVETTTTLEGQLWVPNTTILTP